MFDHHFWVPNYPKGLFNQFVPEFLITGKMHPHLKNTILINFWYDGLDCCMSSEGTLFFGAMDPGSQNFPYGTALLFDLNNFPMYLLVHQIKNISMLGILLTHILTSLFVIHCWGP